MTSNNRTIFYLRDIALQPQSAYVAYLPGDPNPLAVDSWEIHGNPAIVEFFIRNRLLPIAVCPNRGWTIYARDLLEQTSTQAIKEQVVGALEDAGIKVMKPKQVEWAA